MMRAHAPRSAAVSPATSSRISSALDSWSGAVATTMKLLAAASADASMREAAATARWKVARASIALGQIPTYASTVASESDGRSRRAVTASSANTATAHRLSVSACAAAHRRALGRAPCAAGSEDQGGTLCANSWKCRHSTHRHERRSRCKIPYRGCVIRRHQTRQLCGLVGGAMLVISPPNMLAVAAALTAPLRIVRREIV